MLSKKMLPDRCNDLFSLRTINSFKHNDEWVKEGSYLVVNPHDRTISEGRLMIFFVHGMFDMRRCHVGEQVWLERASKQTNNPPIILTKEDAFEACVGWVQSIMPRPTDNSQ